MNEPIKIPLGNDVFATIDQQDQEIASQWRWHLSTRKSNGRKAVLGRPASDPYSSPKALNRIILGLQKGQAAVFRDGNPLNNTRENLLVGTVSQLFAHENRPRSKSGAKGVSFDATGKKQRRWRAYIVVNEKQIHLGYFASRDEAIAARREAEEKHQGEFANKELKECDPGLPQILDVTWFPPEDIHELSGIDKENKTATCSICGPLSKIRSSGALRGWKCRTVAARTKFKHRKKYNRKRDLLRRPYIFYKKGHCERCPFIPVHPCQLDVHHKDYNSTNNDPDNLETICANCHRLETQMRRNTVFAGTDNTKWVGRKTHLDAMRKVTNSSGVTGVSWNIKGKRWLAFIGVGGKHIHIGSFKDFDEAVSARKEAEQFYCNAT